MLCLLLPLNAIAPPIIPNIDPNMASPIPVRPNTEKANTAIPHMVASCDLLLNIIAPTMTTIPEIIGMRKNEVESHPPISPGPNHIIPKPLDPPIIMPPIIPGV